MYNMDIIFGYTTYLLYICACHFVFLHVPEHVNIPLSCLDVHEHTILYREFSPHFIFIQFAHIDNGLI